MTAYYTRRTPDYSPLVVHFTKEPDRGMVMEDIIDETHPLFAMRDTRAIDRLINILLTKSIHASPMPDLPNNAEAVCFTECIWPALMEHAERYSSYGVAFSKRLIFENSGGPALYIRGDILRSVEHSIPPSLEPFLAPFDPTCVLRQGVPLDWIHEREWRLPSTLSFEYTDVKYVIVATIDDARRVIQRVGSQHIPEENYIPMDVYRTIGEAWFEH